MINSSAKLAGVFFDRWPYRFRRFSVATYTKEARTVEGKTWIHVKWSGKNGWIIADYVKIL